MRQRAPHGGRLARVCCALALVWLATAAGAPAAGVLDRPCPDRARVADRPDGWTDVRPTPFAAGPQELTAYAAAPTDERVLLVTNGVAVQRSGDGGCTWQEVYRAAPVLPGATAAIREIVATPRDRAAGPFLVSLAETYVSDGVPVIRSRVAVSLDAGVTWAEGGTGLPPVGAPARLRIGGLRPGFAYLLVRGVAGRPPAMYRTEDAGLTWRLANGPSPVVMRPDENLPPVDDFVVEPGAPSTLYAWSRDTVWRSRGSGYDWAKVPTIASAVTAFDIAPSPVQGRRTRLRVFRPDGLSEYSDDNAVSWLPYEEGDVVTSVASIPVVAGLYATASDRAVRINGVTLPRPIDVTPYGARLTDLSFTISNRPYLYGRTGDRLLRRELKRPQERVALGDTPIGLLRAVPARRPRPASFHPARLAARLDVGERRRVTTTLTLPPDPTPLDVYFLSDTTGSMAPVVDGLRQDLAGIVNQLADAGIAAWFGVADFREYPIPPWGNGPDNFPYRRLRAVGPVDEDLRAALARMDVGGGARNGSDSALEALFQSATGAGRVVVAGTEATPVRHVDEALDAEFRDDAVRVIVLASDTAWREPEPGYPGPSEAVTFAALNRERVRVVGLAVGRDVDRKPTGENAGGPGPDLRQVADATGTRAPGGGVDCDGDGARELPAGAPLVCPIDPTADGSSHVGPAMASLLAAVADPVPVTLRVRAPGARIVGDAVRVVDRKRLATLPATVEVSCDDASAGRTFDARIDAEARGRVVASAVATVTCGVRAPVPPDLLLPPPVPVVVGAVPILPVAPAPPAPIPQPNPNVNTNPNPQPNAQAGFAAQDREEHELAFAAEDGAEQVQDLAFTRYQDPALPLLGAAALSAAAAAAHRRTRTQPAPHRRSTR